VYHGRGARDADCRAKATLRGADQALVALDGSPDGTWLAAASVDRTLKVWDLRTERLRQSITGHSNKVR
jgi:WD40 repeat protein